MPLAGFSKRFKITSDHLQVPSNQSNFPAAYSLAGAPSEFFDIVDSNGDDVRVTLSDGLTEVPFDLIAINTSAKTGWLKLDGDFSSGADDSYYIYYDNATASPYARGDTYGSENVYPSHIESEYHLEGSYDGSADEVNDSTSNLNHGRGGSNSGDTDPDQVTGRIGNAQNFNGTDDAIDLPTISVASGTDRAFIFWLNPDTLAASGFLFVSDTPLFGIAVRDAGAIDTPAFYSGGWVECGTAMATGSWQMLTFVFTGTTCKIYIDDTQYGGDLSYTQIALGGTMRLGHHQGTDTGNSYDGKMDEVTIHKTTVPDDDWITTKFNIENPSSTFWTTGVQEDLGASGMLLAANF